MSLFKPFFSKISQCKLTFIRRHIFCCITRYLRIICMRRRYCTLLVNNIALRVVPVTHVAHEHFPVYIMHTVAHLRKYGRACPRCNGIYTDDPTRQRYRHQIFISSASRTGHLESLKIITRILRSRDFATATAAKSLYRIAFVAFSSGAVTTLPSASISVPVRPSGVKTIILHG